MSRRLLPAVIVLCAVALSLPVASASAASRMLVGFMDDASFRWDPQRKALLDQARNLDAQVIHTIASWRTIAPRRPADAKNSFDPAYNFADLDELVRSAQERGIEVLITIWGTPAWANGGKGPNYAPKKTANLKKFAQALASRYSGKFVGYPGVRYFSLWNESNLQQFLAPQFDENGHSVGPKTYAKMYRAAYKGFNAGNPNALVAIGETSPQGRDRPSPGPAQDSHSPGRFAQLLSEARPRLKFDAWAHHPYPTRPGLAPTQRVNWPNVTLLSMPRFETSLDSWFHRKNIPIWITEYGHETVPPGPEGVSWSKQKKYLKKALTLAREDDRVQLFTWFVFQDSPTNKWSSGLIAQSGAHKPSFARFGSIARVVDGRNPVLTVKAGRGNPTVGVPALEIAAKNPVGTLVGVTYRVFDDGRPVTVRQPAVPISRLGYLTFSLAFTPVARHTYRVGILAEDVHGNAVSRTVTLQAVK